MKTSSDRETVAGVPMRAVGPLYFAGPEVEGRIMVPLATYEQPLWPSVARGARVTARAGGLRAAVLDDRMTRSVLVEAPGAVEAAAVAADLPVRREALRAVVEGTSRHAKLVDLHTQVAGSLLFVRLAMTTGDAAGHNMVTRAADALLAWMLETYPSLAYVSVSGNYCADKKVSAVNGILGRGKSVVCEARIPGALCRTVLRTEPAVLAALNRKKNYVGSILSGGVRSANAHFANMLLAFYLATGQDAANIVEGSQGLTSAEEVDGDLLFSVTLPNLVVGTVGSGKGLAFARDNLERLGCLEERVPGANARRLAIIAAGTVLCGELSLLAAQTNPGELMRAHLRIERGRDG